MSNQEYIRQSREKKSADLHREQTEWMDIISNP